MPVTFDGAAFSSGITVSYQPAPNTNAIFAYGLTPGLVSMSNLVSSAGVVATDTTGVGTARADPSATGYGSSGQAIFNAGQNAAPISSTNLVSNLGVMATDTPTLTGRYLGGGAMYGTDKGIFAFGAITPGGTISQTSNFVSNTGVMASNAPCAGTAKYGCVASSFGSSGQCIFSYGVNSAFTTSLTISNIVSNTGVVASDVPVAGTARYALAGASYGTDKAIFGYGVLFSAPNARLSITNLVSNTGVVASDTTGVGTARNSPGCATYNTDKAIFGYGNTTPSQILTAVTNKVSNTGVVATDTPGVGTARTSLGATSYGAT